MRGLISAAFLLAPALASALGVPEVDFDHDVAPIDRLYTQVNIDIPAASRSPDDWQADSYLALAFRIQIFNSEAACGYGNVTVDGQELAQTLQDDLSTGRGTFSINRRALIASWSFQCIKINGLPDSQFMKFFVEFVDGKALQNVGFSVLFRQAGPMGILNIERDLSIPDQIAANPNPQALQPADEDADFPEYDIEDEIAELYWMQAQLHELQYLILEKEQSIRMMAERHFESEIGDCDSLKCLVKTVAKKAKSAAHHLYEKIRGDENDKECDEEFDHPHFKKPHFPKPPCKKPHFPKPPFHGGKNCTGPPKGNHTHPGRPHFPHIPLPICRYPPPPPPPHHGKPPGHPPGHPPPGHPPPGHPPPGHPPPGHPPPGHPPPGHPPPGHPPPGHPPPGHPPPGHPPPGHPPGHPPGPPPEWAHEPDFHHGPDMDGPHNPPHHPNDMPPPPPGFDGPHHGEGHEFPPNFDYPPHHRGPGLEFEQERFGFPGDEQLGPSHRGPPPFDSPLPHGPGPRGFGKAFHVIEFVIIGFLFAFLIGALHRRACTPKRRADRQTRREERHRRRAYRRAMRKNVITRLLARVSGNESDSESDDYEEKRRALLSDAEDGMSTTMTEDITQLRNAAEVVGDIVFAEEDRSLTVVEPMPIPATEARPRMQELEILSQVCNGEELPAYEDNDGSESSSFVADGFRYTPGSSEYSPSHSPAGSVSDILGPDTKS